MLSLRYEDHLYAKLFHHLISLHHHDHEICWVWWKHGLEIRIKSNTWRVLQWRWRWLEGGFICFDLEARVKKWSKREWESQSHPQTSTKEAFKFLLSHSDYSKNQVLNFCHPLATCPKEQHIMSYVKLVQIPKINEIRKIHIDISY